jgi:hypothetical protein
VTEMKRVGRRSTALGEPEMHLSDPHAACHGAAGPSVSVGAPCHGTAEVVSLSVSDMRTLLWEGGGDVEGTGVRGR